MKRIMLSCWVICVLCIILPSDLGAQVNPDRILRNARNRAERNVEKRVEDRIDKAVDKALDGIEEGIDGKGESDEAFTDPESTPEGTDQDSEQSGEAAPVTDPDVPTLIWSSFDFVPGDVIIFEDNLEGERNGEFPSKWDLVAGTIENAKFGEDNVIFFRRTTSRQGIVPLIKDSPADYLPDAFTIEFDAYFEADVHNQIYYVNFFDMKNHRRTMPDLRIYVNKAVFDRTDGNYPGARRTHIDEEAKWRRVSISFNQRALKVYLDEARLLNIPNIADNPTGITIRGNNPQGDRQAFIKNVRIAKGAVPLYEKFLTDGKIITNGIRFDVNKATIRPESMGVINEIVQLMNEHPELKFSVEGHTDSDGSADHNQRLSEQRSEAVMKQMVAMGIASDRLTSAGHGQNRPLAPNDTQENKARNRRVEFVRL